MPRTVLPSTRGEVAYNGDAGYTDLAPSAYLLPQFDRWTSALLRYHSGVDTGAYPWLS
jgi:hypothetical protein